MPALLLPQGVCVCDLMQKREACADCSACVEQEKSACAACQHKRTEKVEDDTNKTCTCTSPRENPETPDHHVPSCPPKSSAQWKADTASAPQPVYMPFVGLVTISETTVLSSSCLSPSFLVTTADQPLFLTLLTLRI